MLTDTSSNFKATWEFVDRRIEDLVWLSKAKSNLGTLVSTVASGAYSIIDGLINRNNRRYNNNTQQHYHEHHNHENHSPTETKAVDQQKSH